MGHEVCVVFQQQGTHGHAQPKTNGNLGLFHHKKRKAHFILFSSADVGSKHLLLLTWTTRLGAVALDTEMWLPVFIEWQSRPQPLTRRHRFVVGCGDVGRIRLRIRVTRLTENQCRLVNHKSAEGQSCVKRRKRM